MRRKMHCLAKKTVASETALTHYNSCLDFLLALITARVRCGIVLISNYILQNTGLFIKSYFSILCSILQQINILNSLFFYSSLSLAAPPQDCDQVEDNVLLPQEEGAEELHSSGDLPEGLRDLGEQMEERPSEEVPTGTSPPQVPPKHLPQLNTVDGGFSTFPVYCTLSTVLEWQWLSPNELGLACQRVAG